MAMDKLYLVEKIGDLKGETKKILKYHKKLVYLYE